METQRGKGAQGGALLFIAQLTLMLTSYVVALALARGLGPELYGAYGVIYSFLLSVELVGRLGLPQAVSKLVAERSAIEPALEATGFTLSVIVFAAIFLAFWLAAPLLGELFNVADGTRLFRIAALDIPFYGVYFMLIHILTGRRRFGLQCLGTIVYGVSKAVGILVLVAIGPSLAGALVVNAIGSMLALAVVAVCLGRATFRLTLAYRGPIIQLAAPVSVIALGTQTLVAADLWMLNAVGPTVDAAVKGLYVAAVNVARIPNFVAFVVTAVLVPSIAAALAADDLEGARAYLGGAARFLILVLVPGCALIAVNAADVLVLLFSSKYAGGADLLVVLVFAHGLLYTTFLALANALIGAGRAAASARLALTALTFALGLSITGVLWAGALGAAFAALVANAAAVAGASIVIGRTIGWPAEVSTLPRVLLLTAAICVPGWWIEAQGLMLLLELGFLGTAYVALLPVAGLVDRTDIELFLSRRLRLRSGAQPAPARCHRRRSRRCRGRELGPGRSRPPLR
jgi:O-antigen/teichoic acid export membrane protein